LITAVNSAAYSDFIKILKENNTNLEVDFYPVQVQGRYSEIEIINALNTAGRDQSNDSIVLIRGGGSLEDLITFNSEKVARTIFSQIIPVIVGVGHEKDESIADFVADIRASTPSQAAYYLFM
jgi:exodeoxyribonuclease VII large subunit